MFLKRYLIYTLLVFISSAAYGQNQEEKGASIPLDHFYVDRQGAGFFRTILSKVHFGLSTGYGRSYHSHSLDGFGVFQKPDSVPKIFSGTTVASGYTNWFNKSQPATNSPDASTFLVSSDTTELKFKTKGFSIPIKATMHVEFERYRIGGGYSIEYTHIGDFAATTYKDQINSWTPEANNFFLKKYFGMIGGTVYRYDVYSLVMDANIGGYSLGNKFDKSIIKRGVYINVGATVEREMSEYFRLFIRPSFELKGYKLTVPETSQSITHKFNAFYLNIGASYRFPELRRCFHKDCRVQINHSHGNKNYRSRVHPIYKKQNPHYGENHPKLIKYKGKNKKKLNPY